MDFILGLVAFICLAGFVIGLIKPSLVKMPSRKKSCAVFGVTFFAASFMGAYFFPPDSEKSVEKEDVKQAAESQTAAVSVFKFSKVTLGEYKKSAAHERHEMVDEYVRFQSIPLSAKDDFYACMSEHSVRKSEDLNLEKVLGWCNASYTSDPQSLSAMINLDAFFKNFSPWDGSYRPLEKAIKQSMNDDSSYKHVSTTYRLQLDKDPHAVVNTTFRGTNEYGGVVKQTVSVR